MDEVERGNVKRSPSRLPGVPGVYLKNDCLDVIARDSEAIYWSEWRSHTR